MKKITLFLILALVLVSSVSAISYYYASWGSDSSPTGNATAPFLTLPVAFNAASCTDKVVGYGNSTPYNSNSGYTLEDKNCTLVNNITVTSTQGKVKLKGGVSNYETIGGITWTNTTYSNSTYGIWRSTYSTGATDWACFYNDTKQAFFIHTPSTAAGFTAFRNYTMPWPAIYWNGTPDNLWLKLDPGVNPSTLSLICTKTTIITISNSTGIVLSDMELEGGYKSIYSTGNYQLGFINLTEYATLRSLDLRAGGNYTIYGNNLSMKRDADWWWYLMKGSALEATAIYLNENLAESNVINNDITGFFNGVFVYDTSAGKSRNTRIQNNRISDIYDDAIELEDFTNCYDISGNNVTDVLVAISLSPANGTQCKSHIHHNILVATKSDFFDYPSTYYTGEVYKILDPSDARNFNLTQNTEIGRIFYSDSSVNSLYNVTHTNSIDYVPNSTYGRLYERTGLASNGNIHDYNLYWPASIFAKYYNSDTNITDWSTLAEVKASGLNATNWDYYSVQANPLFYDFANGNYRPNATSQACTMSSTGSYVGALPCSAQSSGATTFLYSSINTIIKVLEEDEQ